ncbi:MAG TPA: ERF family protein [Verrucomicrobiae bacterium]
MTRSESLTHLATALAQAQAEMPVAVFDATNPFLKSKYASLGAVIQASRPILAKHKLSLVQFPISNPHPVLALREHPLPSDGRGDFIGVESILTHESGEFISERIVIALTEEKGKSRVQSAAAR